MTSGMAVQRIGSGVSPAGPAGSGVRTAGAGGHVPAASKPFSQVLKEAVAQVNELQIQAERAGQALARGEVSDLHALTLAIERAQLALELTVAVRNKLVEAYQEISRMPI